MISFLKCYCYLPVVETTTLKGIYIHMPNINVLPLTVQLLWPMLKFSKCRSKVTVRSNDKKNGTVTELLSQETHIPNIKALPIRAQYCQYQNLSTVGQKVPVKVTCSKRLVPTKMSCHKKKPKPNIKALPLTVQKLWSRLKFLRLTEGQTDERIRYNVPCAFTKAGDNKQADHLDGPGFFTKELK